MVALVRRRGVGGERRVVRRDGGRVRRHEPSYGPVTAGGVPIALNGPKDAEDWDLVASYM